MKLLRQGIQMLQHEQTHRHTQRQYETLPSRLCDNPMVLLVLIFAILGGGGGGGRAHCQTPMLL